MSRKNKLIRRNLDKKLQEFRSLSVFDANVKSWIKTIRQALGLTTYQLAKKTDLNQSRIVAMEKEEENLKISTLQKVADALDCKLVYALVPKNNLEEIAYNQARKKALKMLSKINHNMALENQASDGYDKIELEDMIQELLNGSQARLWDEDE